MLVQEGATVGICSRSLDKLQKTAQEIGAQHFFTCDLSKSGEAKTVIEKAITQMGWRGYSCDQHGRPEQRQFRGCFKRSVARRFSKPVDERRRIFAGGFTANEEKQFRSYSGW